MTTTQAAVGSLRTTHVSGLHNVVSALGSLHRERLRAAGEEQSPVQLSVMNIVAACTGERDALRAADDLTVIGSRHPARAILVRADPEAPAHIEAEVSLRCAADTSRQLCTELLHLDVGGEAAYHLSSIVTPLLVPDIPVQLWLVGAPPLTQAFAPEVVKMCERIILDSGAYTDARATLEVVMRQLLRFDDELSIADLAWERIRGWRLMIAQAVASQEGARLLRSIDRVHITSGRSQHSDALLCGGWIASRIAGIAVECSAEDGAPGLHAVRLWCGGSLVEVRARDRLLEATISAHGDRLFTQMVQQPVAAGSTEEARLIVRMMAEPEDDAVYRGAVHRAVGTQQRDD